MTARILGSLRSADGQGIVRMEDRFGIDVDDLWSALTDPGGLSYDEYRACLPAVGFRELTRTQRGWSRETAASA